MRCLLTHMILRRVGRSHRNSLKSGEKAARLAYFARGSAISTLSPGVALRRGLATSGGYIFQLCFPLPECVNKPYSGIPVEQPGGGFQTCNFRLARPRFATPCCAACRVAVVGRFWHRRRRRVGCGPQLERLSQQSWQHPSGRGAGRFAASTIERRCYQARAVQRDPVEALRRRPRADAGRVRAMSAVLIAALHDQYRAHPSWSAQLRRLPVRSTAGEPLTRRPPRGRRDCRTLRSRSR